MSSGLGNCSNKLSCRLWQTLLTCQRRGNFIRGCNTEGCRRQQRRNTSINKQQFANLIESDFLTATRTDTSSGQLSSYLHNRFTGKGHGTIHGCHPMWGDIPEVSQTGCQTAAGITWGERGTTGVGWVTYTENTSIQACVFFQYWLQLNNSVFSIVWCRFLAR